MCVGEASVLLVRLWELIRRGLRRCSGLLFNHCRLWGSMSPQQPWRSQLRLSTRHVRPDELPIGQLGLWMTSAVSQWPVASLQKAGNKLAIIYAQCQSLVASSHVAGTAGRCAGRMTPQHPLMFSSQLSSPTTLRCTLVCLPSSCGWRLANCWRIKCWWILAARLLPILQGDARRCSLHPHLTITANIIVTWPPSGPLQLLTLLSLLISFV